LYRKLRLCSGGGGIEAVPDGVLRLDLAEIRAALNDHGIPVIDARVMLIAKTDPEVTIARTGRLLFKTADASAAERTLERLRAWVTLPAVRPD
jgi:hypothetical protein